jgi:thiamine biosynthesis lipoprotein
VSDALLERDRLATAGDQTAFRSMQAIGTTATVGTTDARAADRGLQLLAEQLSALDETCSRFRSDSEIVGLEGRSHDQPIPVSPLLFEVLEVACVIAARTAGIVDPTVGSALVALGYDRDFAELDQGAADSTPPARPAPGWWRIRLDPTKRTVAVPDGMHLDLGATAKAFAADRAAQHLAGTLECGVLVNLGGDVAVAGRGPRDGWSVGIASHCTTPVEDVDLVLAVHTGGVATSGTTGRSWTRNGRRMHHIVDPWTGEPAPPHWSMVSTLAPTCVEANAWSTAAVVWGPDAPGNLSAHDVAARLVNADGRVTTVGNWPSDLENDGLDGTGH